ncbi:MAG: acyloxyacyl hydrolase [Pseudomonadota bacterium]
MHRLASLIVISLPAIVWTNSVSAKQSQPGIADKPDSSWHLLGGFGSSHPGWGGTKERVETVDLILRHERPQPVIRGQGWYRNRRSIFIEAALHHLQSPDEPPMFGLYFQSCWTFRTDQAIQPYLFVGGGPVYTRAEIPGTSSAIKGSYQAGVGVRLEIGGNEFSLDYRFHHLSNGGIKEPNDPLNSDKLLFGMKLDL